MGVLQADENGNFTAELPYPTTENSNLTENLKSGDKVSVFLLSGSIVEGDTPRGGEALSATVAEKKADTAETCAPAANHPGRCYSFWRDYHLPCRH